jgi:hypothetical protein
MVRKSTYFFSSCYFLLGSFERLAGICGQFLGMMAMRNATAHTIKGERVYRAAAHVLPLSFD